MGKNSSVSSWKLLEWALGRIFGRQSWGGLGCFGVFVDFWGYLVYFDIFGGVWGVFEVFLEAQIPPGIPMVRQDFSMDFSTTSTPGSQQEDFRP